MGCEVLRIVCIECRKGLTEHQRVNSGGICPHCNHRGANAYTKIDVIFISEHNISVFEQIKTTIFGVL